MRAPTTAPRLREFMRFIGTHVTGPGTIYLVGGASAVLIGWREMTIDADLKADPEPAGLFEAIVQAKAAIDINVELAAPDEFIPELPGWRERSPLIDVHGRVTFRHYDFHAQALAKIERGHDRDRADVLAMHAAGLIEPTRLRSLFAAIEPRLIRYPSIDPEAFRRAVESTLKSLE